MSQKVISRNHHDYIPLSKGKVILKKYLTSPINETTLIHFVSVLEYILAEIIYLTIPSNLKDAIKYDPELSRLIN